MTGAIFLAASVSGSPQPADVAALASAGLSSCTTARARRLQRSI